MDPCGPLILDRMEMVKGKVGEMNVPSFRCPQWLGGERGESVSLRALTLLRCLGYTQFQRCYLHDLECSEMWLILLN